MSRIATRTISTRLAIEGEAEYRQSVAGINNSLKTLKSELALVESQFRSNANSQEALAAKGAVLEKELAAQKRKVEETKEALAGAEAAQRTYAAGTADLGAKIANAEKRLAELANRTGDTAREQGALNAKLAEYKKEQTEAQAYQDAAQRGVEDWRRKLNYANRDLNNLNGKVEDNAKYLKEAENAADHCAVSIDQYGKQTNQAAREFKNANEAMNALAAAMMAAGISRAAQEVAAAIRACVDASVEFESAVTGVRKTVDGTEEQLTALADGIKRMSTEIPSSTTEIAAVAAAAGQLGIRTEDILSFTRVMLDLGQSTNLGAEEAASALAKFANVTGMGAEAGGSAISKLLKQFEVMVATGSAELEGFAQVAGMSAQTFSAAWKQDAVSALSAFLDGLGAVDAAGGSSVATLNALGITETRMSNAVLALAGSQGLLGEAVAQANAAWAENTALSDEAGQRYATTESKLAMMRNAFVSVKAAIGDALTPALREMAAEGTNAFSWAAAFIERHPWLVQAIAGVATATAALVAGLTALTVVHKLTALVDGATGALSALNLVLKANPALAVASAIAGLTVAVGTFVASAREAGAENQKLLDGLDEAQKAYQETAAALDVSKSDTLAMAAALEDLAGTEHKTAAQKETLLELVNRLNEAVPNLSLAYDQGTDSLNLTAEAVRNLVQAEADRQEREAEIGRLTDLEVARRQITEELTAATEAETEAEERKTRALADGTYGAMGYEGATQSLDAALVKNHRTVEELKAALADNAAETAALEEKCAKLDETAALTASSIQSAGKQSAMTAEELAALSAATAAQTKETRDLISGTDTLSEAFAEQTKNGGLSLNTALKLIDAGYANLVVTDQETGAIRLNTEAYGALTKGKLDDQIASLTSQRESINNQIALRGEAETALAAANAYWGLALAKKAEADSDVSTEELEKQRKSLDAQIAALTAMKNNLGSIAAGGGSKRSGGGKSAAKSRADEAVEAYKEAVDELDYLRDLDEINEETYYQRLEILRDKYLKADSDAWRDATVKLHKYREDQAAAAESKRQDAYSEELADIKYFLDMDIISEQAYYRRLAALRDEYLEADSDAWRQANTQLHQYLEQCREEELEAAKAAYDQQLSALKESKGRELDALKEAYDADKKAAKDAYDTDRKAAKEAYEAEKTAAKTAFEEKKAQIKNELALEKERLGAVLDGIDAEIQARRELREDEDQDDAVAKAQKRLEAAKAQLEFARTDEDRAQWEKEIVRLQRALEEAVQAKEDTAFYREKEREKDAVKDQISQAEQKADGELAQAERDYAAAQAELERGYQAKTEALEKDYQAKLAAMEAAYQAEIARIEAEYKRRADKLESDYKKKAQDIENSYESGGGDRGGSKDGFGGDGDPGDYVVGGGGGETGAGRPITADDILNAGPGGYGPDGLHFKDGYTPAAAMAGVLGAAAGAAAVRAVNQTTRNNSASITIQQAPSLTEGQIARTVRKVLDTLDR